MDQIFRRLEGPAHFFGDHIDASGLNMGSDPGDCEQLDDGYAIRAGVKLFST